MSTCLRVHSEKCLVGELWRMLRVYLVQLAQRTVMAELHKLGLGGGREQGKHQQCEEEGETDELERHAEPQPQETSTQGLTEKRCSLS